MTAMLPNWKRYSLKGAEPGFTHRPWFHGLLLLLWVAIGASLRFTHLTAKPPWLDEFATLVFSLGHSFRTVPLNQAISLDTLMQPLQVNPQTGINAVIQHLLTEDVHPPLYFVLAHWWMGLFASEPGLASLWAARALPALLGVVSIPAMFGLGWLAARSPLVGHFSAAMMAVSPFGVYLTQEARHYSLAILWVIASLCCFVVAIRCLQRQVPLPIWLELLWIGVNGLGIASHYFFLLTLAAMAIALIGLAFFQGWQARMVLWRSPWRSIYAAILGTALAGIGWLPILQGISNRDVTQWIQSNSSFSFWELVNPIFQALGTWIAMLVLLPVESDASIVVLAAGSAMAVFLFWAIPLLHRGLWMQQSQPENGLVIRMLSAFVLGAIALFFFITYGLSTDITRGARYNFVYFPGVILLLGASLAGLWNAPAPSIPSFHRSLTSHRSLTWSDTSTKVSTKRRAPFYPFAPKTAVVLILLVGFLSGLTVVNNLGYRKYYRPDILIPVMQGRSQAPILIATTENSLEQTGEMMGLGWQFYAALHTKKPDMETASTTAYQPVFKSSRRSPQFLLAHEKQSSCKENCPATATLRQTLTQLSTPFDLWLVNFHAPVDLQGQHCVLDVQSRPYTSGYDYSLYHCS